MKCNFSHFFALTVGPSSVAPVTGDVDVAAAVVVVDVDNRFRSLDRRKKFETISFLARNVTF